jgi:ribonuclease-3
VIADFIDKIRLLFVREKKPFLRLKSILGFYPRNIKLYRLALLHKSMAVREHETHLINNERLEFLGDAILGAIVADILYKQYSNEREGFLTNLRSNIVCRNSLNRVSQDLGLDKLIRHAGAITTGHNSFMSGNALEAFVGAIYLDRGYKYCYRFIEKQIFHKHLDIEAIAKQDRNYKSTLIEWCQKYQYKFEFSQQESRDDQNAPVFHSSALVEDIPCGTGDGYSKKESDQNAAHQALKRLKRDRDLLAGIQNARAKRGNEKIEK